MSWIGGDKSKCKKCGGRKGPDEEQEGKKKEEVMFGENLKRGSNRRAEKETETRKKK